MADREQRSKLDKKKKKLKSKKLTMPAPQSSRIASAVSSGNLKSTGPKPAK
jgi:hypothetical protein